MLLELEYAIDDLIFSGVFVMDLFLFLSYRSVVYFIFSSSEAKIEAKIELGT